MDARYTSRQTDFLQKEPCLTAQDITTWMKMMGILLTNPSRQVLYRYIMLLTIQRIQIKNSIERCCFLLYLPKFVIVDFLPDIPYTTNVTNFDKMGGVCNVSSITDWNRKF